LAGEVTALQLFEQLVDVLTARLPPTLDGDFEFTKTRVCAHVIQRTSVMH